MLSELQTRAATKPTLEAKLRELRSQKWEFNRQVSSLRLAFREEQADVEKLEGKSLANYFFRVVGQLDEKMDRERQEAYAAKVKLDAAQQELEGIESDILQMENQLKEIQLAEAQYREIIEKKRAALKDSGTAVGDQIIEMEQSIAVLEAQKQEIMEAITAGRSAGSTATSILSELNRADSLNIRDMCDAGGIITHVAKHEHLDTAQDLVCRLQSELRRFKTELADIHISANMQVRVDGFLRFADFFFDGLFADWAVGDRISNSISSVSHTKGQIERTLERLREMEKVTDSEIAKLRKNLDDLIVKA